VIATPNSHTPTPAQSRPVVASYIATFLKPEMLHIYRQITALQKYRAVVFTQKHENAGRFPFEEVVLHRKPLTHPIRRIWQKQLLRRPITIYGSEARKLIRSFQTHRAALLHVYFGHIGVHLLPLLERTELPVVLSFHGADAQVDMDRIPHRRAMQRALSLATRLLVRSASLGERLIDLGADPHKIRLHRTGIPLEQIPFQQRCLPPDGRWHCLQACRLIPKKGIPTTLRAFAVFARQHPNARLTLAGEGPEEPALRALAGELGIAPRVDFTGFLPQGALQSLRESCHLFLHPSELGANGDQEGVPNSMLESMAAGIPIVATRHGGILEAVEHGTSGLLVAERDWQGLADAMLCLASTQDLYSAMSRAAHARVVSQFALGPQVATLESIYDEVARPSALGPL
jgi:colanic acid/amylovoran biosynthesis glycosyltransferase